MKFQIARLIVRCDFYGCGQMSLGFAPALFAERASQSFSVASHSQARLGIHFRSNVCVGLVRCRDRVSAPNEFRSAGAFEKAARS